MERPHNHYFWPAFKSRHGFHAGDVTFLIVRTVREGESNRGACRVIEVLPRKEGEKRLAAIRE